jgi:hypothetical protein
MQDIISQIEEAQIDIACHQDSYLSLSGLWEAHKSVRYANSVSVNDNKSPIDDIRAIQSSATREARGKQDKHRGETDRARAGVSDQESLNKALSAVGGAGKQDPGGKISVVQPT